MPSALRLEIEPHDPPSARKIAKAVSMLHEGAIAAYPTDSVYALGCAIEATRAIERIYEVKRMSDKHKLAIICPDLSTASHFAHFSQAAFGLAKRIWPGPYTLLLPASKDVPRSLFDKKRRQIGVRVPVHPVTQALVRGLGRPLLTTSATIPGESTTLWQFDDVRDHYEQQIDLLIDSGPCEQEPTTILEITGDQIEVLREGLGPIDDL